jgi:Type I phosphodiesterase / nucleotide pyrophosphatase
MKLKNHGIFFFLLFIISSSFAQQKTKTENVILITFDGLRWQELFSGAESRLLLNPKFVQDTAGTAKRYWRETPQQRRELLMPFFWNVIAKQGQLYGNRNLGNYVNTTNKMWFSYPGYNEILTGVADDARINSNDPMDNPNQTVLEFLNKRKEFQGKVAAFSSWETFPWIINTTRSGIPVNAGYKKAMINPNEQEKLMNELMFQIPNESGGTRPDAFTFHFAFEYLKKNKPRVLFISFDETDHFAHEGEYDRYLASAQYTDGFIKTLWEWIQTQPTYKDKTTIVITTDHGRGEKNPEDWKHHGSKMPNADEIWFAFLGPDTPALGEVKATQQVYQNQVASTLSALLGIDYKNEPKPGEIISTVIKK